MQNLSGKIASGVKLILLAPLAALLILTLAPALAAADDTETFFAVLNGGQVVALPETPSTAVGNALMTFDEDSKMLCWQIIRSFWMSSSEVPMRKGPAGTRTIGAPSFSAAARGVGAAMSRTATRKITRIIMSATFLFLARPPERAS